MPAHCACPIDSGCSGTLPWVPSMGSLRAGGISLMGRQELLWLQTLGQRAQNKCYNGSRFATYTSTETGAWGESRGKVWRRAAKTEENDREGGQAFTKQRERWLQKKKKKRLREALIPLITALLLTSVRCWHRLGQWSITDTHLPVNQSLSWTLANRTLAASQSGHCLLTVYFLHDREEKPKPVEIVTAALSVQSSAGGSLEILFQTS